MSARPVLSPLGVRIAVAFVAVAVAAQAFEDAGGWTDADLTSAAAVAARGQAELTVVDADGAVLAAPASEAAEMMARMHGIEILDVERDTPVEHPVTVAGAQVGTVQLRFPTSHLPAPEREIRQALVRNASLGAALTVGSAIAVAVIVARVVSRPITALTDAAEQLESGRRDVRVDLDDAPGEIGTLAAAFDRMAAAVDEEDRLRRQLVADVAHEVRTPLTPTATAAELTFEVSLDTAPVAGDSRGLRQLATTLIANALTYTPPGGTIRISTRTEGSRVVLDVADTGPGIDADELHRIFDRFYRGRRTAGSSGSGIGLAVARELAAAHDGTVTATNAAAGGAVFRVALPADTTAP